MPKLSKVQKERSTCGGAGESGGVWELARDYCRHVGRSPDEGDQERPEVIEAKKGKTLYVR